MPNRRTKAAEATADATTDAAVGDFHPAEFDPTIAEKKDEIVHQVAEATAMPENGHASALDRARARLAPKQADPDKPKRQDPHFTDGVSITAEKGGPQVHLGRSTRSYLDRKTGQKHAAGRMVIKFDQKPDGEFGKLIFNTLREHGWDFDKRHEMWDKPINPERRWQTHADAEKLFRDIANSLRDANGLPPVTEMGHTAA